MKSWLGLGQVAVALCRDIANPADRHATEKKIASLSAALSNEEDETLVTLKRPRFIQWR